MTSSPVATAGLTGLPVEAAQFWAQTERDVAALVPLPQRTTDAWLDEWIGPVRQAHETGSRHPVGVGLVGAGVALGDLAAYATGHLSPTAPVERIEVVPLRLLMALSVMVPHDADAHGQDWGGGRVPRLRVRDAIGWLLVHQFSVRTLPHGTAAGRAAGLGPERGQLVQDWTAVGLGHDGWLYAAAGLSPDEAAAALADGSLDEGRAQAMAVLRGVALPVG